jgi:hypothetical protein
MVVYLAHPGSASQACYLENMPVLISFANRRKWMNDYIKTYSNILIDSGAFSEMNSGIKVDGIQYKEWYQQFAWADAIAGLDDINGDWKRSLRNYEKYGGFPTIHDTDPEGILNDLIEIAYKNRKWLGIGLKPPRQGKEDFIRRISDRIPDDIHIHGFALRAYTHIARLNSVDSTAWFRNAMIVKQQIPWLTYSECIEIIVKRYKREMRKITDDKEQDLFK